MRTDFFSSFSRLSEGFRKDWDALWTLSPGARRKLLPYILERLRADTTGQAKEIVERAVAEIGGEEAVTLNVLDALGYVASEWNPLHDTAAGYATALAISAGEYVGGRAVYA